MLPSSFRRGVRGWGFYFMRNWLFHFRNPTFTFYIGYFTFYIFRDTNSRIFLPLRIENLEFTRRCISSVDNFIAPLFLQERGRGWGFYFMRNWLFHFRNPTFTFYIFRATNARIFLPLRMEWVSLRSVVLKRYCICMEY